jgi:hypothetical protein
MNKTFKFKRSKLILSLESSRAKSILLGVPIKKTRVYTLGIRFEPSKVIEFDNILNPNWLKTYSDRYILTFSFILFHTSIIFITPEKNNETNS